MPSDLTAAYIQIRTATEDPDPRAAVLVASLAHNVDDARDLLDALGLDRVAIATASALLKLHRHAADPVA